VLDIGFSELLLLGAVALIVLGPEKLPHAARMAGAWYGKIRRSLASMQAEIEREVNLAEMRKLMNDEIAKIKDAENGIVAGLHDIEHEVENSIRPSQSADWSLGVATPLVGREGRHYYFYLPPSASAELTARVPLLLTPQALRCIPIASTIEPTAQ
jgi:sec-independent protein translocase protein TatB